MNKYEQGAEEQRRAVLRNSTVLGTAGVAFLVVVLLIVGLNSSAPPRFFSVTAIAVAVVLLVLRQLSRRGKGRRPRAAQPDPRSTLKLH